jgi:mRNA-degrading endonuclease RelE of RelBE toxin-antitoxin system
MAYFIGMEIRESSLFTRQADAALDPEELRALQLHLVGRPEAGAVIPGSGGLRKLRWAAAGRGKRGGVRVIYYWYVEASRIYLLLLYVKNERDDLSPEQKRILKRLVMED